jgi:hypothetical protein
LILSRRPAHPLALGEARTTPVRLDDWIAVEPHPDIQFAEVPFRLTLRGRLTKVLYRIPAVFIDLRYRDGGERAFRIIPDVAEGGLLLSDVPRSLAELGALVRGELQARVASFRFRGAGLKYYQPEVVIRWRTARHAAPLARDPR